MLLVDTSVWIDYFNSVDSRQTALLDETLPQERPLIGDLILAEVLQGFRTEDQAHRAQALLAAFEFASIGGYDMAVKSARNYRLLRQRGITVRKTIDVLIATFCIEHGHVLLHADRDFERMRDPLGLVTI
jgi:predicted nucleic acid-binding protein